MRPVATEFQGTPSASGEKKKDKVMSPTALPTQISITGLPARKRSMDQGTEGYRPSPGGTTGDEHNTLSSQRPTCLSLVVEL